MKKINLFSKDAVNPDLRKCVVAAGVAMRFYKGFGYNV